MNKKITGSIEKQADHTEAYPRAHPRCLASRKRRADSAALRKRESEPTAYVYANTQNRNAKVKHRQHQVWGGCGRTRLPSVSMSQIRL